MGVESRSLFFKAGMHWLRGADCAILAPSLLPSAPSDLDSSLHMDLGISEPAHVRRLLGQSLPEDQGTCGEMRSGGSAEHLSWPPMPMLLLLLFLYPSLSGCQPSIVLLPTLIPSTQSSLPRQSLPPSGQGGLTPWASPSCSGASRAGVCGGPRGRRAAASWAGGPRASDWMARLPARLLPPA